MADNFDLKKFLKESKALENLNPIVAKTNLSEGGIRERIREYILAELSENEPDDYDPDPYDVPDYETENPEDIFGDDYLTFGPENELEEGYPEEDEERDEAYIEGGFGSFEEAKKKDEEVEDVEVTDTETEEVPAEEAPAADGGGLEDIAANMEGTESELMKNLMDALQIAKGMGNEKLETQIGNTLKFFVSEYIGSGQE
jgi:hypothetical protein